MPRHRTCRPSLSLRCLETSPGGPLRVAPVALRQESPGVTVMTWPRIIALRCLPSGRSSRQHKWRFRLCSAVTMTLNFWCKKRSAYSRMLSQSSRKSVTHSSRASLNWRHGLMPQITTNNLTLNQSKAPSRLDSMDRLLWKLLTVTSSMTVNLRVALSKLLQHRPVSKTDLKSVRAKRMS